VPVDDSAVVLLTIVSIFLVVQGNVFSSFVVFHCVKILPNFFSLCKTLNYVTDAWLNKLTITALYPGQRG